jgi:hypothetical protein
MRKIALLFTALVVTFVLLLSCGPTYLSEPPPEFYNYVSSIPTPRASTQLAEDLTRWTSPKQVCTGFALFRLYGANEDFTSIKMGYEHDLSDTIHRYVKLPSESDLTTFVIGEYETVGIDRVSVGDPSALLHFDEETLSRGQDSFKTLFVLDVEHSYGNCVPHPYWR